MAKILIVDDEENNRDLLRKFFDFFGEDADIILIEAVSGAEAVEKNASESPDLILMDIKMETDVAGLDATRAIRSEEKDSQVPIWAVTSQAMESYDNESSDREKCLMAGCNEYYSKPFDTVELVKRISELLDLEIPAPTKRRMGIE